jgi:hypothetical protein
MALRGEHCQLPRLVFTNLGSPLYSNQNLTVRLEVSEPYHLAMMRLTMNDRKVFDSTLPQSAFIEQPQPMTATIASFPPAWRRVTEMLELGVPTSSNLNRLVFTIGIPSRLRSLQRKLSVKSRRRPFRSSTICPLALAVRHLKSLIFTIRQSLDSVAPYSRDHAKLLTSKGNY